MFRDKVSGVYDLAETVYNGKVYRKLGEKTAGETERNDTALERPACSIKRSELLVKWVLPKQEE